MRGGSRDLPAHPNVQGDLVAGRTRRGGRGGLRRRRPRLRAHASGRRVSTRATSSRTARWSGSRDDSLPRHLDQQGAVHPAPAHVRRHRPPGRADRRRQPVHRRRLRRQGLLARRVRLLLPGPRHRPAGAVGDVLRRGAQRRRSAPRRRDHAAHRRRARRHVPRARGRRRLRRRRLRRGQGGAGPRAARRAGHHVGLLRAGDPPPAADRLHELRARRAHARPGRGAGRLRRRDARRPDRRRARAGPGRAAAAQPAAARPPRAGRHRRRSSVAERGAVAGRRGDRLDARPPARPGTGIAVYRRKGGAGTRRRRAPRAGPRPVRDRHRGGRPGHRHGHDDRAGRRGRPGRRRVVRRGGASGRRPTRCSTRAPAPAGSPACWARRRGSPATAMRAKLAGARGVPGGGDRRGRGAARRAERRLRRGRRRGRRSTS